MKGRTIYLLLLVVVIVLIAAYKTKVAEHFQLQAVTGPQMLCAIRNGQANPGLVAGTAAFKQFVTSFNVAEATQKQATDPNYVRKLVCPTPAPGIVSNTSQFCGPLSDMYRNKKSLFKVKC